MSEKNEIIKKYKIKVNELKIHNNYYFNEDSPRISDAKYDELKKEILSLENENPFLKELKLLKNLVGSPPSNKFKKIKHLKPMLSLSNAFNSDDMKDFLRRK